MKVIRLTVLVLMLMLFSSTIHADELEAWIDATGQIVEGGKIAFDITTNLPDGADLMLTLINGDFNTDDHFMAQQHVTVSGGVATSEPFSNNGEPITGDYDLSVSMSIPSAQPDTVRAVIGENGENLTGSIVTDTKAISALFLVLAGDNDIFIVPEDDYTQTTFRVETTVEEPVVESTPDQAEETQAVENQTDENKEEENKAFIDKYDNTIVAHAKMALDNFIGNYKLSLAPQMWTLAVFDDKGAVIASTKVTYKDIAYTYYYVGTLNFEGEKVVSSSPHYLALDNSLTGAYVLGNDHYCDEVFKASPLFNKKAKSLDNLLKN